jgi:hypothetical protein
LIQGAAIVIMAVLLLIFVRRDMIRQAIIIFLFKQLLTWLLGLIVVEFGLIVYPIRFFPNATKSSFTFEYLIYPAICVIFNLHYPNGKSRIRQFLHFVYFCSAITVVEVLCERYTDIIKYIHWTWYATWISLFLTFYISRKFYVWFFKNENSDSAKIKGP